jgi:two-component system, NtrC family, response regulator HydG
MHFTLPPLRNRPGDVGLLAEHFVARYGQRYGKPAIALSDDVRSLIEAWPWHGNVRELAHALEAAVVACDDDTITNIGFSPNTESVELIEPRQRYSYAGSPVDERRMIRLAIEQCAGNKTRAALRLGMSRNTLLNKLRADSN